METFLKIFHIKQVFIECERKLVIFQKNENESINNFIQKANAIIEWFINCVNRA